jgi:hypothetical protein
MPAACLHISNQFKLLFLAKMVDKKKCGHVAEGRTRGKAIPDSEFRIPKVKFRNPEFRIAESEVQIREEKK